jgi:serine/threonine protein kinase
MIAFFSESEIVTGDRIVNGSSCDVYDIIEFRQQRRVREILGDEVSFVRDFLARNVRHSKTLNPRYVVKVAKIMYEGASISHKAKMNALQNEITVLRSLNHPNIIKPMGLPIDYYLEGKESSILPFPKSARSFLMTEKVHEMLQERIDFWKRTYLRVMKPVLGILIDRRGVKQKHLLIEQLNSAVELASALEYLHANNYLHGDLAPSNIGFSNSGNLVLFDFDHSTPMNLTSNTCNLDGLCIDAENLRYHCPTVIKGGKYKESSEVYSFARILYEILSLKPCSSLSHEEYQDCMVPCGNHPQTPEILPLGIQTLIRNCWNANESKRPSMMEIHKILQQEKRWATNERIAEDLASSLISLQTSSSNMLPSHILRFQRLDLDINQARSSLKNLFSNPSKRSSKTPPKERYFGNIQKTPAA